MGAFALLDARDATLADFDEVISDDAVEALSCTIPPRFDASLPAAVDEARSLRPAYDRALARFGRTVVGRRASADEVPDVLAKFSRIVDGESWDAVDLCPRPIHMVELASDVRAYYEEAAQGMTAGAPAPHAAEAWFYKKTAAGRLFADVQQALRTAGVPRGVWFYLVPVMQQPPKKDTPPSGESTAGAQ